LGEAPRVDDQVHLEAGAPERSPSRSADPAEAGLWRTARSMASGPAPAEDGRVARARAPGAPRPGSAPRPPPPGGGALYPRTQPQEGALGSDDVPGVVRSLSSGAAMDVRRAGLYVAIMAAVIVPLYVLDLGGWVLLTNDEARFPAMARDIVARGHWLAPAIAG